MLISFLKKNCSELDFLDKVISKCNDLPFSSMVGLLYLFNKTGLKDLNIMYSQIETEYGNKKDNVKENIEKMLNKHHQAYKNNYSKIIDDRTFKCIEKYLTVVETCNLTKKQALEFSLITLNYSNFFKTEVMSMFTIPSVRCISLLNKKEEIFQNLEDYITIKEDADKTIFFNTIDDIKMGVLHEVFKEYDKTPVCFSYTKDRITTDKPEQYKKPRFDFPESTDNNENSKPTTKEQTDLPSWDPNVPF